MCSDVFSSAEGRKEFSQSVLDLNKLYGTDGIDLDWEYPAVEGYPDHAFKPADRPNFTALVRELRNTLGNKYEITFAAGGFQQFLDDAVEWKEVMSVVDRVNLMTYDLVNGNSIVTGHHTGLYSSPEQHESTDNAVQYLIKLGYLPTNWSSAPPFMEGYGKTLRIQKMVYTSRENLRRELIIRIRKGNITLKWICALLG